MVFCEKSKALASLTEGTTFVENFYKKNMLKRFLFLFSAASFLISQVTYAQNQAPATENANQKAGYFNTTELNFSRSFLNQNRGWITGIQTINGYKFNNQMAAGIGIGIDQLLYTYQNFEIIRGITLIPIFTDFRLYFGKKNTQPYFSQSTGYAFCIYRPGPYRATGYNKQIGGLMMNPSFGIKTPLTQKTSLNIGIGYRFQQYNVKYIPEYYGTDLVLIRSKWTFDAHYINLKAGLTF